jgi:plasmid stabilization system protein ParE
MAKEKIVWTEQSRKNLLEIYDHIATYFTPLLADKVTQKLIKKVALLSKNPRLGKISDRFPEIREYVVEGNIIFYRINVHEIVIAAIHVRKTKPIT